MSDYKQEQQIKNNDTDAGFDNYLSDNKSDSTDYPNYSPDNTPYNSDDDTDDEKQEPTIWSELNEMRNKLRGFDIRTVKSYINTYLKDDVSEIKKQFHTQFDDVEDGDDLKIEVLILLGELGIQIFKKKDLLIDDTEDRNTYIIEGYEALDTDDDAVDEGSYTDDDEKKEYCTNENEITDLCQSLVLSE